MSDIKRKSGVIGWPVAHSRSPLIHNFWLEDLGIEGSYDLLPLEPERADEFLKTFADSGLVGANVTLPHKEAAFRCITETDAVARRLGRIAIGTDRGSRTMAPGSSLQHFGGQTRLHKLVGSFTTSHRYIMRQ